MSEILLWIAFIAGGFLLGSILFSSILPKLIMKKDVTALSDDGNPGAFNVFSTCGPVMGTICMLLDVGKGFLPVFLATFFLNTASLLFAAVIVAPVLGHSVGIFNHFHGGKCIAVSFGVTLGLLPVTWVILILAGLYIFFSVIVKIKSHRLRSLATFGIFAVAACVVEILFARYSTALGCFVFSAIAFLKHTRLFSPADPCETHAKPAVPPDPEEDPLPETNAEDVG